MILLLLACGGDATDTSAEPTPACDAAAGAICTWAGTGEAAFNGDGLPLLESSFYWPVDVEFSPYGAPVIQDWNNHKIRIVQDDGTLQTIIGTLFLGDGPADQSDLVEPGADGTAVNLNHPTDAVYLPDGVLMCANWHNHKLRTWDPVTGKVMVYAGSTPGYVGEAYADATDAKFNMPKSVDVGPDGTLYILDMRNERIRVLTPDFTIATLAGTGEASFSGDDGPATEATFAFPNGTQPEPGGSIALSPDGQTLYVLDTGNNRVRAIDLTTGIIATIAGTGDAGFSDGPALSATFNAPRDLEVDANGDIYIADTENHAVRRLDLTTGTVSTVAGTGEQGFDGEGGPATDALLYRPFGVEVDSDGLLYISDTYNHRIRVVYP